MKLVSFSSKKKKYTTSIILCVSLAQCCSLAAGAKVLGTFGIWRNSVSSSYIHDGSHHEFNEWTLVIMNVRWESTILRTPEVSKNYSTFELILFLSKKKKNELIKFPKANIRWSLLKFGLY